MAAPEKGRLFDSPAFFPLKKCLDMCDIIGSGGLKERADIGCSLVSARLSFMLKKVSVNDGILLLTAFVSMERVMKFTLGDAQEIGDAIGVEWDTVDLDEFRRGLSVELEHGSALGGLTNVTGDNLVTTGRIALAHLLEIPDYYTRLERMEADAFRSLSMYLG